MEPEWKSKKEVIFHMDCKRPLSHSAHKHMDIVEECALASEIIHPKYAFGKHKDFQWLEWYLRSCNRIGIPATYKHE
jgi:hypothetical protein